MRASYIRGVCAAVVFFCAAPLSGCGGGGGGSTAAVTAAGPGSLIPVLAASPVQTVGEATPQPNAADSTAGELASASDAFVDSIGINTQLIWGTAHDNYPAARSALVGLHVRHLRDGLTANPVPGYFEHLNELATSGIQSTLVTALKDNADADVAVVDRIGASLESVEGPNEANSGSNWAAPLAAFQHALYAAVKQNPHAAHLAVIGPSLARDVGAYAALGDLSSVLDYGNMHDYPGGNAPGGGIGPNMTAAAHVSATKPIIATETGYCTSSAPQGVTPIVMAKYVPRMFFEQFNAGITRTFEYQLLDDGFDATNLWSQCGLLTHNFGHKPAYNALANLIALLADPGPPAAARHLDYSLVGASPAIHHTLLRKKDSSFFLAIWIEASDFDQTHATAQTVAVQPVALRFGTPIAALTAYTYDDTGGLTPSAVAVSGASVPISVTDRVTIFKIVP